MELGAQASGLLSPMVEQLSPSQDNAEMFVLAFADCDTADIGSSEELSSPAPQPHFWPACDSKGVRFS